MKRLEEVGIKIGKNSPPTIFLFFKLNQRMRKMKNKKSKTFKEDEKVIQELQKEKMIELWNNKEDEEFDKM